MTDGDLKDIASALHKLRVAFAKAGIPCPDVLEYSDPDKAYEAMLPLRSSPLTSSAVSWVMDANAAPYGEMVVMGFTLRFEGREIERPGTGTELDDGFTGRIYRRGFKL